MLQTLQPWIYKHGRAVRGNLYTDPLYRRLGIPYLEWGLTEGEGSSLYDPFNQRDGIIVSGGTWQEGNVGLEWKGDGSADYLNFPNGHDLVDFTNEIIFTPTTIISESIWTHASSPGNSTHDRNIYIDSDGNYKWRIFDGGVKNLDSGIAAVAGKTVHIIVVADGTNMAIYIDGVLAATQAAADAFTGFNTPEITILLGFNGATANDFGDGAVALVRTWPHGFNAEEAFYCHQNRFGTRFHGSREYDPLLTNIVAAGVTTRRYSLPLMGAG